MEKKKRSKILLIIGIVLGIFVVGFGSYFVYDKYFSKDDVVDKEDDKGNNENKDNKEEKEETNNKENKTINATIDSNNLLSYKIGEYELGDDLVVNDFKTFGKTRKLVLNIDKANDKYDYILSVYLDDVLFGVAELYSPPINLKIYSNDNYIVIYNIGSHYYNLFVLGCSSSLLWNGTPYSSLVDENFDKTISRYIYKEKENYIL